MIRALSALFLSLTLALTSHSAAVAKTTPVAVGQFVICTGFGTTVIYTDAEGLPTDAPYLCPDCVVHLAVGLLPDLDTPHARIGVAMRRVVPTDDAVTRAKRFKTRPVRGPPFVI